MDLRVSENGNAVVLILLGVVLFGALVMTLTKSGQQSIGAMTKQQAKIAAQDILSYAQLVEQTVNKLRRKGCSENQLTFQHDEDEDDDYNDSDESYYNANSPTDHSCHIFHPDGGNLTVTISLRWLDQSTEGMAGFGEPQITRNNWFYGMGGPTSTSELIFWIPYIDLNICQNINELLGDVDLSAGNPPSHTWTPAYQKFRGIFVTHMGLGTQPHPGENPLSACAEQLGVGHINGVDFDLSGTYTFHHVLIVR